MRCLVQHLHATGQAEQFPQLLEWPLFRPKLTFNVPAGSAPMEILEDVSGLALAIDYEQQLDLPQLRKGGIALSQLARLLAGDLLNEDAASQAHVSSFYWINPKHRIDLAVASIL